MGLPFEPTLHLQQQKKGRFGGAQGLVLSAMQGPFSSHRCWFEAAPAGAGPWHSETCRSQTWPSSWVESWFETEETNGSFTLCCAFFIFLTPSVIYRWASTLSSRAFVVWALSLCGDAPGQPAR